MLILIAVSGPDKGSVYEVGDQTELVLGRERAPLSLHDPKISREHARIWKEGSSWYIQDCGSLHGTRINREKIFNQVALEDGDFIQLGRTVLVVGNMPDESIATNETVNRLALEPIGEEPSTIRNDRHSRKSVSLIAASLAAAATAAVIVFGVHMMQPASPQAWLADCRQKLTDVESATQHATRTLIHEIRSIKPQLDQPQKQMLEQLTALNQAVRSHDEHIDPLRKDIQVAMNTATANAAMLDEINRRLAEHQTTPPYAVQILAKLDESISALHAQVTAYEQAGHQRQVLAENTAETLSLLRQVMSHLEQLPSQEQLARDVQAMFDAPECVNASRLEAILLSVKEREETDKRLIELYDLVRTQVDQFESVETRISTALSQRQPQPEQDTLKKILREIRSNAIASLDQLRETVRAEISSQIQTQRLSLTKEACTDQATGDQDDVTADAKPSIEDKPSERPADNTDTLLASPGESIQIEAESSNPLVMNDRPSQQFNASDPDSDGEKLTRTETAYKLAFETGQLITIGGGTLNPRSGRLARGKTLDPSIARQMGITNWRDWYLLDDFMERMKLQQQAMEIASSRQDHLPVISLPKPLPISPDNAKAAAESPSIHTPTEQPMVPTTAQ